MARVKGPLMSMTASGSIAQCGLQFRATRHGPQVVIPALGQAPKQPKPASTGQAKQRGRFSAALAKWRALDDATRAAWSQQARDQDAPNGWSMFLSAAIGPGIYPAEFLLTPKGEAMETKYDGWLTI